MGRRIPMRVVMINSAATTVSAGVRVSDFRNCVLSLLGSPGCNLKVAFKGGVSSTGTGLDTAPDFTVKTSARNSASNWDFVQVIDLIDGSTANGPGGVTLSGSTNVKLIEVNINSLDWLAVHATAITAGTVTVVGCFTTNE